MKWFDFFVRKQRVERELDSEIRFHVEALVKEKTEAGLSLDQARREAVVEFGGDEQIKEECRQVHRIASIETTLTNLKSAFRFVRKSAAFSLTVVLTLALGIGANSGVFSAIDAILLRPLPFPQAAQLVVLHQYNPTVKQPPTVLAPVRLEEWNKLNSTFQAISGYYTENVSETSGALPERIERALVAPRFLQVFGVAPQLGRDFTPAEEHFGGPDAVLISDRFWRRRFHAAPDALGKTVRLGRGAFHIVGVMPANFRFPGDDVDLWIPVPMDAPYAQDRNYTWFTAVGRLKPRVTIAQARADLDVVQGHLARQFPKTDTHLTAVIQPLKETIVSGSRRSLWILFGSVSLLLLIACSNIAALLLSRTIERTREISIRYSLGASRPSIIAQLLTEALVLALLGSAAGVSIAAAAVHVFHSLAKALPRVQEITLDWRVALYTLACGILATLLFGLIPALTASRRSVSSSLAQNSRTQVSARAPVQWSLVGVQVALAATLLVGAGLLLRSFQELGHVSPGFDARHVLTLRISGSYGETGDQKAMNQRMLRTLEALRHLPGVESAGLSATLPGASDQYPIEFKISDAAVAADRPMTGDEKVVSAGYFSTMRIPMLAGESCQDNMLWDRVVVNHSFAEMALPGQSVLGHHLSFANVVPMNSGPPEIIGIVGDARENSMNQPSVPTVYWCSTNGEPDPYFLIRAHGDPILLANAARRKIHNLEPNRFVFDLMPLEQQLFDSTAENRFRTLLLSAFALTAIFLATMGLYGTLSYLVSLRRREIGLRMALGAVPGQIRKRFLTQGLLISLGGGCLVGLAAASGLSRVLAGMLYGVSTVDPATYAGVILGVLVVAALAAAIPAQRAARLDPMQTLRQE